MCDTNSNHGLLYAVLSAVNIDRFFYENIFIGSSGISAIIKTDNKDDLVFFRECLKSFLHFSNVCVFTQEGISYGCNLDQERKKVKTMSVSAVAKEWSTDNGRYMLSESQAENMKRLLLIKNAEKTGVYEDEKTGNTYLFKNHMLHKVTDIISGDELLPLLIFGGPLGLHLFALHRYLMGAVYFLTGGLFGVGPIADYILLYMGGMRVGKRRISFDVVHFLRTGEVGGRGHERVLPPRKSKKKGIIGGVLCLVFSFLISSLWLHLEETFIFSLSRLLIENSFINQSTLDMLMQIPR